MYIQAKKWLRACISILGYGGLFALRCAVFGGLGTATSADYLDVFAHTIPDVLRKGGISANDVIGVGIVLQLVRYCLLRMTVLLCVF